MTKAWVKRFIWFFGVWIMYTINNSGSNGGECFLAGLWLIPLFFMGDDEAGDIDEMSKM